MIRYRLYTEDIPGVKYTVQKYFKNFTAYLCTGFYNGKHENSICIEIIADKKAIQPLRLIAEILKQDNNQESILITQEPIKSEVR